MKGDEKNKLRIASLILLVLPAILLLPAVYATKPASSNGTFTITNVMPVSSKTAGGNTFTTADLTFALTGVFSGKVVETATTQLTTASGHIVDVGGGTATFTGTVNGASGTLAFLIVGNNSGGVFHGHFTIISGTGGLANLRGEGTFQSTSPTTGTYTAQLHSN